MDDHARHAERRALPAAAGGFDPAGFDPVGFGPVGFDAAGFDADVWGASPSWAASAEQPLYDDDDLDAELVPQARSLFPIPD
jgi:hypothetical protein